MAAASSSRLAGLNDASGVDGELLDGELLDGYPRNDCQEVNRLNNWFSVREVGPQTWAISDGGDDTIYLVEGQNRALLIDTGWGIGDLPALVASLTNKPVTVVNSHGHPDHAYGDSQFPTVHVHSADVWLVEGLHKPRNRQHLAENAIARMAPAGFDISRWAASVPHLVPIASGHVFDLGGRQLEAINLPGHTPGGLVFLDRASRQLFTGDSILAGPIWMHLRESLPLGQFLANLEMLRAQAAAWDVLLPAHSTTPLAKTILDDLIVGIGEVVAGRLVGRVEHTIAGDGLRCDFGTCGVVYDPERLR